MEFQSTISNLGEAPIQEKSLEAAEMVVLRVKIESHLMESEKKRRFKTFVIILRMHIETMA